MNRLLFTMTCAAAAMTASAADYIAHWDFSSDANGEIDVLGNYGLDNSDGVTIANGAAVFDGTAKCLCTKREIGLSGVRAYTIECFAKADTDCDGMIMELSPNINDSTGSFYLYANEGAIAMGSVKGRYNGEKFDNGNICDGQWHHIAVIVNPSAATAADKIQLYLDRVRQTKHVHNNADTCVFTHRLYIGSRGGTTLPFKGMIDDVRITDGILSTDQFLQARTENQGLDVRAYWKFDDGDALADASGNGNALQGSQGVAFVNGCASFDGTASDVRTVNMLDLSAYKDATIEFFVRRHAEANSTAMVLEHSVNYFGNQQGFCFTLGETRPSAIQGCFRFGNGHRYGISPTNSLNSGWHHVALVKDSARAGNTDAVVLYVDGMRQSEYVGGSTATGDFLRNDYLYIGSRANNEFFLNGDIDDVRITAQVLLPGQFLQTRTGAMEDVIAYWPFDASNMLADASGNGNTLTGSGVTVNDNGAVVFDGSQSGFATLAPLPLYAYDSMTVEWFMKSDMSGTAVVLESSEDFNNHAGAFCALADGGSQTAGYRTKSGYNYMCARDALDGRWHHFALVYDWDDTTYRIVRFYCDGVLMTEFVNNYGSPSGVNLYSGCLFIGSRGGSSLKFVGDLDDVKITGRALTPVEFMKKRSKPPRGIVISVQ